MQECEAAIALLRKEMARLHEEKEKKEQELIEIERQQRHRMMQLSTLTGTIIASKKKKPSFEVSEDEEDEEEEEVVVTQPPEKKTTLVLEKKRKRRSAKEQGRLDWPPGYKKYDSLVGERCLWCFKKEKKCGCWCPNCTKPRFVCLQTCPAFIPDSEVRTAFLDGFAAKNMGKFRAELKKHSNRHEDDFVKLVSLHYQAWESSVKKGVLVCSLCYVPYAPKSGRCGFCNACGCFQLVRKGLQKKPGEEEELHSPPEKKSRKK